MIIGKINAVTDCAAFLRMIKRESLHQLESLRAHGAYNEASHRALIKLAKEATVGLYQLRQELALENAQRALAEGRELPAEIEQERDVTETIEATVVDDNPREATRVGPCRVCSICQCGGIRGGCFCTCHELLGE